MTETLVHSVDSCPVCSSAGAVIVLVSRTSGEAFFHCPFGGTAWSSPPPPDRIDDVASIDDVAPGGARLPTREELKALKVEHELADPYWRDVARERFS